MKKNLLCCCSFLITACSIAQKDLTRYYTENSQVCGGIEEIMKIKGSWKKTDDAVVFPDQTFPRNQYKFINARIDSISLLAKEALPEIIGIEPRWYRSIRGNSYTTNGAVPYGFASLYFNYYCNTNVNKILLGDETGTWAYVFVNHYNWFCDKVDDWDINGDGKMIAIYMLPPKAGQWKETTLYEPRAHGKFCRAVVIGHNGKLPWHTLTQKQYLTGVKKILEMKKKQAMDHHNSYEEKLKKNMATPSKNISAEQAEKIRQQQEKNLKDYQNKKQGYIESTEKFFSEKLNPIYDYLSNNPEETLNQPAVIDPRSGIEGFKGRFGDEDKGGIKLIAFSSKYFNNDLPRYASQFMILYWRWTEHPVSLNFKKQFEENFPLEKLKKMIDK